MYFIYFTGIANLFIIPQLKIYPNPVLNGKLKIEVSDYTIKEGEQIIMTDIIGQIVQTSVFYSSKIELDVSSLASGVYNIQIGNVKRKFMKQ
jgi:hypothetical protein